MIVTPEDVADIAAAAATEGSRLKPEDRFDLRQELALKLLSRRARPESVKAWALHFASLWVLQFMRDEKLHRELLDEARKTRVIRPYRKDSDWFPTWHAPHADAREFAPFACEGARVMHCSETHSPPDVEEVMAQYLDSKGVWKKDR